MYTLENDKLKIVVKQIGAELCRISSIKNGKDFMWHADPEVWEGYAPNLFPFIGALKNNTYIYENKAYNMPKHGFLRHNQSVKLHHQSKGSLTFKLKYNESLLKIYPFKFEFYINYQLTNNKIEVTHTVKNCDAKTMYFSVGGHPAFKCPVYDDEDYDDYILEFEKVEGSKIHLINLESGLQNSKTKIVFNNSNHIQLKHDLFNDDALIFKDLKSKKVTLKSNMHGTILSVDYKDFSYLGIWAKPNANYVCIEPWLGIADHEDTNQILKDKEGILTLNAGATFNASYGIEIDNNHLV